MNTKAYRFLKRSPFFSVPFSALAKWLNLYDCVVTVLRWHWALETSAQIILTEGRALLWTELGGLLKTSILDSCLLFSYPWGLSGKSCCGPAWYLKPHLPAGHSLATKAFHGSPRQPWNPGVGGYHSEVGGQAYRFSKPVGQVWEWCSITWVCYMSQSHRICVKEQTFFVI